MKIKYILIIFILVASILTVIFYGYRWTEIHKQTNIYYDIKHLTVEFKLINSIQKTKLSTPLEQYNYDGTTLLNKNIDDDYLIIYLDILNKSKDNFLISSSNKIKNKNKILKFFYEDYKTDNIKIKNSIKWLSNNLKYYVDNINTFEDSDKEIMQKVFNILLNIGSIKEEDFNHYQVSNKKFINSIIKHLQVLSIEVNQLLDTKEKIENSSINLELKDVYEHTILKLEELRKEVNTIGVTLFLSVVFLIIFGLFIYFREVVLHHKIAKLKNELQQLIDAVNESVIVSKTNLEGNITYVNKMFCDMSGYSSEELIGSSHNIIRHSESSKELFIELWETIQDKKVFRGRIQNLKKNGDAYFVDVVIIPFLDIDGNISEYISVRNDVTEIIESRDIAILAEKAKGDFLSNMSHELRTPLNSINGFTAILQRTVKIDKHLIHLQNIKDSSDHLIGLINDILDLSKLQIGKFNLDYHDFNLDKKLRLLVKRFDAQIIKGNLKLNLNFDSSIKVILKGDWLRITQIITNLISNAIKFTSAQKEVDLNVKYENDMIKIVVRDTGIGMSEEAQSKIFKPFEQADSSTTKKYAGTGLGLSIVINLIKQMHGEINLVSKVGEGSTFSVSIPLKKSDIQIFEDEFDTFKALNAHILIAEDNKTNQLLIGILMDEFGVTYKIVNDGIEAVDMFGKEDFDLVLMDENMPNLNGIEAMKQIYKLYEKPTPIVALTANAMSGDEERFLKAGMNGYISKPIENKELYRVIKSLLRK